MEGYEKIKLLMAIVDTGKGDQVIDIVKAHGSNLCIVCHGRGTASSDMLDMLGIGASEKELVLAVVPAQSVADVFKKLKREMYFHMPGHGIAFTIDINSVGGRRVMDYLAGRAANEAGISKGGTYEQGS